MWNRDYPVALGLTDRGWVSIYGSPNKYRGVKFEDVLWLREPSEEMGMVIETGNQNLQGIPNLLVPNLWRAYDMKETKFSWNIDVINEQMGRIK